MPFATVFWRGCCQDHLNSFCIELAILCVNLRRSLLLFQATGASARPEPIEIGNGSGHKRGESAWIVLGRRCLLNVAETVFNVSPEMAWNILRTIHPPDRPDIVFLLSTVPNWSGPNLCRRLEQF
jgi:hypothetical protein